MIYDEYAIKVDEDECICLVIETKKAHRSEFFEL